MDSPPPPASSSRLWIAPVLFAVSMVVFTLAWIELPLTTYDGRMYMELAHNIPRSGYEFLGEPHTKLLPLYPALMALGDWVTGFRWGPEFWGHVFSSLSGALITALLYLLSRKVGASERSSLVVALLHLFLAAALDQYRDVSVVPLFTVLITGTWWLAGRDDWFAAGLVLGLAATTRYEAYLLVPFLVLTELRQPSHLGKAALGFVLTAAYWWGHNLLYYGQAIHSKYFTELFYFQFHLFDIARDSLIQLGPVLLILAVPGFLALERKWKWWLAGFGVLYIGIHTTWWWYADRFLLPLVPLILPPAALGLDLVSDRLAGKGRAFRLLARAVPALAFIWFAAVSALTLYQSAVAPPDPYNAAAASLRDAPAKDALLGANPFLLQSYSGHEAYSWQAMKTDEDPSRFVYKYYRYVNVRYLIWGGWSPIDRERFPFLDGRVIYQQTIEVPAGKFRVTYLFMRSFTAPPKVVNIYEVKVQGPLD